MVLTDERETEARGDTRGDSMWCGKRAADDKECYQQGVA